MKSLLLPLLAALALPTVVFSSTKIEPEPKSQILNNPFERLGKETKFNCKEFGDDSCFSRFIAMSACSFAQSINSGKNVKESLDIADDLFYLLTTGNKLDPNDIFDEKNLIKQDIRVETIERVKLCEEWAKEAIPKIVLERTGKPATPEFIEGATRTYGMWWLSSLEQIKSRGYK
tara:strand:- start:280 stop:804 length:525 start_codon:yes stop_codon:yes gene_type:complete